MLIPMLAKRLLTIGYVGENDYGKVTFAATGGTDAGLLTLKDGTTTETLDLGDSDNDTLAKLEAEILNQDSEAWNIFYNDALNRDGGIKTANFTQRTLASLAERNIVHGDIVTAITFGEDYETMPADQEADFQTPIVFNTRHMESALVTVKAKGSIGNDGVCEVFFGTLGYDKRGSVPTPSRRQRDFGLASPMSSLDWSKAAVFSDSIRFNLNGADEVRVSKPISLIGVDWFFAKGFSNPESNTVQVEVFI